MIGLIQRVSWAKVVVNDNTIAQIEQGILVLLGMEKSDDHQHADKLLHRLFNYRIFADEEDKMNLSVSDVQGGVLLVPQFTLAADTKKGLRPGFSSAMPPAQAADLFSYIVKQSQSRYDKVAMGKFGADMQVSLLNDGPVTFSLTSH